MNQSTDIDGAKASPLPVGKLTPTHMSTRGMPPADQFLLWQDVNEPFCSIMSLQPIEAGFIADQTIWDLGNLAIIRCRQDAAAYERSARHVRTNTLDHWIIGCSCTPKGDRAPSEPGGQDPSGPVKIWSLGINYRGVHGSIDELYAVIPRETCVEAASELDDAVEAGVQPGPAALMSDYMASLEARLPELTADDLVSIQRSTHAIITCCLHPRADHKEAALNPIDATLFERARQLIGKQLLSPALGAEYLCAQLGVSRSRLYRIFSGIGGVAAYIRHKRLLSAHKALYDPNDHRYISEIAADLGFLDSAEFSRTFRREFGYRPKDVRHHSVAAAVPRLHEFNNMEALSHRQHFLNLLKGLG